MVIKMRAIAIKLQELNISAVSVESLEGLYCYGSLWLVHSNCFFVRGFFLTLEKMNRPLIKPHVNEIAKYLLNTSNYIERWIPNY